jgi:DNA-directed RNA polymerase subunit RPC12/RpoP
MCAYPIRLNICVNDEEQCCCITRRMLVEEPLLELNIISHNIFNQEVEEEIEVEEGDIDIHKAIAKPLFNTHEPLGDCPICYEKLKMINFTVTTCGHKFHSSCIFTALEKNGVCPYCRHKLIVQPDYDDNDDENADDYYDDDYNPDDYNADDYNPDDYNADDYNADDYNNENENIET